MLSLMLSGVSDLRGGVCAAALASSEGPRDRSGLPSMGRRIAFLLLLRQNSHIAPLETRPHEGAESFYCSRLIGVVNAQRYL